MTAKRPGCNGCNERRPGVTGFSRQWITPVTPVTPIIKSTCAGKSSRLAKIGRRSLPHIGGYLNRPGCNRNPDRLPRQRNDPKSCYTRVSVTPGPSAGYPRLPGKDHDLASGRPEPPGRPCYTLTGRFVGPEGGTPMIPLSDHPDDRDRGLGDPPARLGRVRFVVLPARRPVVKRPETPSENRPETPADGVFGQGFRTT